ncbi:2326_t:CDS:1, partial [Dentiscutata heterogama]
GSQIGTKMEFWFELVLKSPCEVDSRTGSNKLFNNPTKHTFCAYYM